MTKQKVMPPKRLETLFPAITFAIEEYRRIFSCRMARKFFWGIFGYKKNVKLRFFSELCALLGGFQSGCMTIRIKSVELGGAVLFLFGPRSVFKPKSKSKPFPMISTSEP